MTIEGVLGGAVSNGRGYGAEGAGVAIPTEAVEFRLLVGTGTKPAAGPNVRGVSKTPLKLPSNTGIMYLGHTGSAYCNPALYTSRGWQ